MKEGKKKGIVIGCLVVALIAAGATAAAVIINNNNANNASYAEQVDLYDRYVKAAEKVNNFIDDAVKNVDETAKENIGEDQTKINLIVSKKEELIDYKIIVLPDRPTEQDRLKKEIEDLEKALSKIDVELIHLSSADLDTYKLSKYSIVSELANDIAKLTDEINILAGKETKKEQEARKAEEKKKEQEAAKQKILNGDITAYNGPYKSSDNEVLIVSDDHFELVGVRIFATKDMKKIEQASDGSYKFIVEEDKSSTERGSYFQIAADGKKIDFCEGMGCVKYVRD